MRLDFLLITLHRFKLNPHSLTSLPHLIPPPHTPHSHRYDMRYLNKESGHRIAILYLPLVPELVIEAIRLALLPHNNTERKELLAMLLSILGDLTGRILRDCIRQLCQPNCNAFSAVTPVKPSASFRTRLDKEKPALPIMRLLLLLHLSLDTFEFPETVRKDKTVDLESHSSTYKQVTCPCITLLVPEINTTDLLSECASVTEVSKRYSGSYSARMGSVQPLKPRSGSGENNMTTGLFVERYVRTYVLMLYE